MLDFSAASTTKAVPVVRRVTGVAQAPDRKLLALFTKREPLTPEEWDYVLAAEAAAGLAECNSGAA